MPPFVFITYFNICLPFQQKIYLKCVQIIWHLVKDSMSNYGSKDLKYFRLKLKVKLERKKKKRVKLIIFLKFIPMIIVVQNTSLQKIKTREM